MGRDDGADKRRKRSHCGGTADPNQQRRKKTLPEPVAALRGVKDPVASRTAEAPAAAASASTHHKNAGWAPIADRLNPNRPAFDAALKERWPLLSKKQRRKLLKVDRQEIAAVKARSRNIVHSFEAVPEDHCETSPTAYEDIVPVLRALAEALGKPASELRIYDPYFCAGAAQRHLAKLGFPRCHNVNEDFYLNLVSGNLPAHDVLLTNPPCECALPASRRNSGGKMCMAH